MEGRQISHDRISQIGKGFPGYLVEIIHNLGASALEAVKADAHIPCPSEW
jgi:hypothetical protein